METFVELLRTQHRETLRRLSATRTPTQLYKALGHTAEIKIPEREYDNLFVLFSKSEGEPTVLGLRYN
jgi:hypothetical protein